jgi:aminopeptidase N
MDAADRVNLLADGWALVQAGRAEAANYLELVEELGAENERAVWEQVVRVLTRLDFLARDRPERPALQAYARAKLRPLLDRLGWDAAGPDEDAALLRARLIRVLGELGDEAILAEAKRRFAAFLRDPAALRPELRDPVTHLVGIAADRADYDTLLALARKSSSTSERVRYYSALASARDPALARSTLELTLSDELPSSLVGTVINAVAASGEQPELAWSFLQTNFETLANKRGPRFRDYFVSSFRMNFSDPARAAELAGFAPVHASSGARMVAARAQESILIAADLKARVLPAVADWIRQRGGRD